MSMWQINHIHKDTSLYFTISEEVSVATFQMFVELLANQMTPCIDIQDNLEQLLSGLLNALLVSDIPK